METWGYFLAAGVAMISCGCSAIGEGILCAHAIDGMSRNPEMFGKLRSTMILGCALVETTGIYCLLIAILCLFVH